MWLISQCTAQWALDGKTWPIVDLVAAAEKTPAPIGLLDVDDPDLLLPEHMPQRINNQRKKNGLAPLDETPANAPPSPASSSTRWPRATPRCSTASPCSPAAS